MGNLDLLRGIRSFDQVEVRRHTFAVGEEGGHKIVVSHSLVAVDPLEVDVDSLELGSCSRREDFGMTLIKKIR